MNHIGFIEAECDGVITTIDIYAGAPPVLQVGLAKARVIDHDAGVFQVAGSGQRLSAVRWSCSDDTREALRPKKATQKASRKTTSHPDAAG